MLTFRRLALFIPVAMFGAAACDDDGIGRVNAKIEVIGEVDFGDVPVGLLVAKEFEIKNAGGTVVTLQEITTDIATIATNVYAFEVPTEKFSIATSATKKVRVTFRPFIEMETPVETTIVVKTDGGEATVKLKGRGIDEVLTIEPNPALFGNILIGSDSTMDVKITNVSQHSLELKTELGSDGKPLVVSTAGNGRFEILATPTADGSLLPSMTKLEPGTSFVVQAKYTPDVVATGQEDRGKWTVSYCSFDYCGAELRLEGRGASSALECLPAMIDYGAVNPGRAITRPVTCANISNDAMEILSWELTGPALGEFSTTPSARTRLEAGATTVINVEFHPSFIVPLAMPLEAALEIKAASVDARPLDDVRIPLSGSAGGPSISVSPMSLDFGAVAIGTASTKRLLVSNDGYTDLVVDMIDADLAGTNAYTVRPELFSLVVGTATIVEVTFAPPIVGDLPSQLMIHSNDSYNPMLTVDLTGQGVQLAPCSYSLQPNPVTFGAIRLRTTSTLTVRFTNTGSDDCLLNDVRLIDTMQAPATVFTLDNGEETGLRLAPNATHDFPITYAPVDAVNDRGFLTFYVSDPNNSQPQIPLFGAGEATTEVMCPANVSVPAGQPITLTAPITTRGTNVTSIDWQIVSAPPGGIGTPNQWNPDPPNTETVDFLAYIVGAYQIHVVVEDDQGSTASCDFVVTAEGHGLRVTMSWNGSGDIDLHLNESTTQPWFSNPNDCYYANDTPIWDAASAVAMGANPELDFDNTSGFGPENTNIDIPILNKAYTVGVHNFSGGNGRTVTIDLYCGGVTAPSATFTSPMFTSSAVGGCSGNEFWKVAVVEFTSQTTCTITPLNTVVTSADACLAY